MQTQSTKLPSLLILFTRMFNETDEVYPCCHLICFPLKAPAFRALRTKETETKKLRHFTAADQKRQRKCAEDS
jgi:hypothetical protein